MVTKLKNINKNLVYLVLSIFLIITIMMTISSLSDYDVSQEILTTESYLDSESMLQELYDASNQIAKLHKFYMDESYIKNSFNTIVDIDKMPDVYKEKFDLFVDINSRTRDNPNKNYYTHQPTIQAFQKLYADELAAYDEMIIGTALKDYNEILRWLENTKDIEYLYINNDIIESNIDTQDLSYFKDKAVYYHFGQDGEYVAENNLIISEVKYEYSDLLNQDTDVLFVTFSAQYLIQEKIEWTDKYNTSRYLLLLLILEVLLLIVMLILLYRSITIEDFIKLNTKLYVDVYLLMLVSVSVVLFMAFIKTSYVHNQLIMASVGVIYGFMITQMVIFLKKHQLNKTILKHSLIVTVFELLNKFIHNVIDVAPMSIRMMPTIKNTQDLKLALEGITSLTEGEYQFDLEHCSDGVYGQLVNDINEVKNGFAVAVEKALKSERLKSDLITNVSHDIRTPLTSIINYVDLLKIESDEEKKKEFLEILDSKSQRLKILIEDLFDAAKASSGNVPIHLEQVCSKALMLQCLGEMDHLMKKQRLEIITDFHSSNLIGDRNALWRVIDNLLNNVVKYALEGSRVYIEAIDEDENVVITIKNISSHALNISVEELMSRFTRGDASRNSDGSGLGLSIAKDLMLMQQGALHVGIDGDLFKATLRLPLYNEV